MTAILLAGATGAIGRLVLADMLQRPEVSAVHILTRRSVGQAHPKLYPHQLTLEALDAFQPPFRVDAAVSCLGTTLKVAGSEAAFRAVDQEGVLAVARLAQRAGAQRFVAITAMGADARSRVFYNRVKGEVETALVAMAFPGLDLIQPSLLLGSRDEVRPGERLAQWAARPLAGLFRGPLSPWRPVSLARVAHATANAALATRPGLRRLRWDDFAAASHA